MPSSTVANNPPAASGGLPQTGLARTQRNNDGLSRNEAPLPAVSETGSPSHTPNTKEKPCTRWHTCMSYAGIWKK